MTSINTNIAAQTALRTLQSTNAQLDATQQRISTGLKIGEAKDNAAYWSIATTLKSDNKALGTVKDALGIGAATVDTAYQSLNAAKDVLDEIKQKLIAASAETIDKSKVQDEIDQLLKQLRAVTDAALFSGENMLSVNSDVDDYDATKHVVSGFNRSKDNVVTIDTIKIDTGDIALIDANTEVEGILERKSTVATAATVGLNFTTPNDSGDATDAKPVVTGAAVSAGHIAFGSNDKISFELSLSGISRTVSIDAAAFTAASVSLPTSGEVAGNDWATVLKTAINAEFTGVLHTKQDGTTEAVTVDVTWDDAAGTLSIESSAEFEAEVTESGSEADAVVPSIAFSNFEVSQAEVGVFDITVVGKTRTEIESFTKTINKMIDDVTTAATTLGSVAKRIELQQSFVSNLMDTIDKGVSGLVDADMNEESTRLQALQVKQQLGVQALSIANQSAQNVLRLFQ